MTNINDILATKRDWRKAERRKADRRVKYGTPEERHDLADALRAGRHKFPCRCSACEVEEMNEEEDSLFWVAITAMIIGGIVIMLGFVLAFSFIHKGTYDRQRTASHSVGH